MKVLTYAFMLLASASAFAPTGSSISRKSSLLSATKQNDDSCSKRTTSFGATMAGLALGFTLVSSSAFATDLDFSLPSYDTKMAGFGEGTEAVLNAKSTSNEKTKQEEAAMKAALALKEKRQKDQEMRKLQYEADKQKALEKKARDAERLKNIWN